jgi:hypothetical protein
MALFTALVAVLLRFDVSEALAFSQTAARFRLRTNAATITAESLSPQFHSIGAVVVHPPQEKGGPWRMWLSARDAGIETDVVATSTGRIWRASSVVGPLFHTDE